jgi:UDP-N-acetylglucosamine diphosphorylase/glucosamine-1-phosphate N-acetyltransferase
MSLILFDDHSWDNLLPLTFTRPVSALRIGIMTIAEKWEYELGRKSSPLTREYLQVKYPCEDGDPPIFINSSILPDKELVAAILELKTKQALAKGETLIAARVDGPCRAFRPERWLAHGVAYSGKLSLVDFPWRIFQLNGQEIEADFMRITRGRKSEKLPESVRVDRPERVFVEPGFKGGYYTLNASRGLIYLGKDSEIMEGCLIRGPFALGEGSIVKMGAKIYGPTTIGPHSKVGGEINNSVLLANSNKAHDGFLGNAVIGEWCNLGADTNNSNLKNNYANVKVWNYPSASFIDSGNQFCGLIMGDHSKCGINTMFNTGTVVGVSANIFGPGFPPNFVPSFSWGGLNGFTAYRMDKVVETANLVMQRRGMQLSEEDMAILDHISQYSKVFKS